MRKSLFAVCAVLTLLACESTPKDAAGWAKAATEKKTATEKVEAIKEVRKLTGDKKAAVPFLVQLLKEGPKVRAEAARALGEIADPSSAQALIEAIDFNTSGGSDRATRETQEANKEIADALGVLRSPAAVGALTKLARSRNNYTQVAAVDALGDIGDASAVGPLMQIATDDDVEPFTAKKAIMALGKIGDAHAAPAVVKMMFRERKGVSFYAESSFAAFQIGRPMAEPLLAILEGKDKDLRGWAEQNNIADAALLAKAAEVLGDLDDRRAVPLLISKLTYKDPDENFQYAVRLKAAESLGRLRAKEAVKALGAMLVSDPMLNAKIKAADALAWIGDREAIPALQKALTEKISTDDGKKVPPTWDVREAALAGISKLGDERELKIVEAEQKAEPQKTAEECKLLDASASDCAEAKKKRTAEYGDLMARLEAAKACHVDAACWAGKLGDKNPAVRERAALEIGHHGSAAQVDALLASIAQPAQNQPDLDARYAALLALDWLTNAGAVGGKATAAADKLDALVEQEKGKSFTIKVDEDVKRLAIKLRRAGAKA